jgi:hypothetical protein
MIAGARVEVAPFKEDPMDFVLWKPSSGDLPGWESPWGKGRPGWHIECSAMAMRLLGESFDIHGGGIDLQFPHHENEIAQSACAHPHGDFAQVWMHNEMLQVEGKKMSKSSATSSRCGICWSRDAGRGDPVCLADDALSQADGLDGGEGVSGFSTRRCATASRRRASSSPPTRSAASRKPSTPSESTTSRADGPARIRPIASSSRTRRRPAPRSQPSA